MSDYWRRFILLAIPIVLLSWSAITEPFMFPVRSLVPLKPADEAPFPQTLYHRGALSVFYTSDDLLTPMRPRVEALVFDVWPAGEGHGLKNGGSQWIRNLWKAFSDAGDAAAVTRLRQQLPSMDTLERGSCLALALPPASKFTAQTGISLIIALAIRLPIGSTTPEGMIAERNHRGDPQGFSEAFSCAIEAARAHGARTLGIPYMAITGRIFDKPPERVASWNTILKEIRTADGLTDITAVTLGTFAMSPSLREVTQRSFRTAWDEERRRLAKSLGEMTHEPIRLTALVLTLALLSEWRHKKPIKRKRTVQLVLGSGATAAAVIGLAGWLGPLLPSTGDETPDVAATALVAAKAAVAALAGWNLHLFVKLED